MSSSTIPLEDSYGWRLEHRYAALPEVLYRHVPPTAVRAPQLVVFNHALASTLGFDFSALSAETLAVWFGGNRLPSGSQPIAQAYAGHQYGHFTMLGDGRAILLGEQITPSDTRFDIQLKGSGPTPYSRRGDGRAALAPMLREYLISEAMAALGIPSTRSLAVVATGEPVWREGALPGAVLTRVAASHLRVGTFEYAASLDDPSVLRALADHAIARHYPELLGSESLDNGKPYLDFLNLVMRRQAALVARWLGIGFIHGVMNTDNMAISGETIDYGPCAFMDAYDPATVFSSIDHHGRYAYANQPRIAQWNLARFAESLLPLLDTDAERAQGLAEQALNGFGALFEHEWMNVMRAKLGMALTEAADFTLISGFLQWMQRRRADFTEAFRALTREEVFTYPAFDDKEFRDWHALWTARIARETGGIEGARRSMRARNPALIPRNHQVEAALLAASAQGDMTAFHRLLAAVQSPFEEPDAYHDLRQPPDAVDRGYRTFCGT